jgi:hypothetical protein
MADNVHKNLDTILMHWMSVKLADNFQIQAFMAVPVSYYFEKLTTHVLSEFTEEHILMNFT